MTRPAIIIAGTNSGAGKTTISLGLMAALKKRGLQVQGFKSGPDFIDPTLHRLVTGTISRNLDLFMMEEDFCHTSFATQAQDADISIIEGVMGMFDGDRGSSFALSESLEIPTILVINAQAMAQSAAAIVKGFEVLGRGVVKGVIANNIASPRHLELVQKSIEQHCEVPLLGYLPRSIDFHIPSRHLGLHLAQDKPFSNEALESLITAIEDHIDLEKLIEIAGSSKAKHARTRLQPTPLEKKVRIAVARDKAFCFYYQDNFDLLSDAGAELVFFSPLEDQELPENIDGLILSGGYPELYGKELSANHNLLAEIKQAIDNGLPCYAECGGFMYLSRGIWHDEIFHSMVGVFDTEAEMKKTRASLGYREITTLKDTILGPAGSRARGHEFHYSTIKEVESGTPAYDLEKGDHGYVYKNCLASYIHLHFGSNPQLAHNFVQFTCAARGTL